MTVTTLATCQARADRSLARVMATPGLNSDAAKTIMTGVVVKAKILAKAVASAHGDVIELDASSIDDMDDDRLDDIVGHAAMHLILQRAAACNPASDALVAGTPR